MAVFLLKFIFFALSTISNLVSRLIFSLAAYLLVLMIQAFKVPGEAIQGGLEKLADVLKVCLEYILEIVIEIISTLISSLFDLVKESISGSVVATGSAIGGLVEQTRTSVDGLLKDFPEVVEGFVEMVTTVVADLWNNYKDALGYVTENA